MKQIAGAVLVPGMDVVHFRLVHVGQAQDAFAQAFQGRDEVIGNVWDGQVHGFLGSVFRSVDEWGGLVSEMVTRG